MALRIILMFVLSFSCALSESFEEFKAEMEDKVRNIADNMTEAYKDRCLQLARRCENRSYLACEGTSKRMCFSDIPTPKDCSKFTQEGAFLGESSSIILNNQHNQYNLKQEEIQFICASAQIETAFKDLDQGRDNRYAWSYIGTFQGMLKNYPGVKDSCGTFDPRYRPWYVAATTGRKNVIIIVDISGSMNQNITGTILTRLQKAKLAVQSVIGTLGNSDTFGLVTFNSEANTVGYNTIVRATAQAKKKVIDQMNKIKPSKDTNYLKAFKKAFSMLDIAEKDEFGAILCPDPENIFLFMTDGNPSDDQGTMDEVYEEIDRQTLNHTIKLFTYAIGGSRTAESNVDYELLKEMACRYNGIAFNIIEGGSSDLVTRTRSYYTYLSNGINIAEPVWTEPYEDAFGLGQITTVAFPIYYTEDDLPGIRIILGVAGIDVTMKSLRRFNFTDKQVIGKLLSKIQCPNPSIQECELESFRNSSDTNAVCNREKYNQCQEKGRIQSECQNSQSLAYRDIFLPTQDASDKKCCGEQISQVPDTISAGAIAGIVIGSIVLIAIIALIVWKCKNRNKNSDEKVDKMEQVAPDTGRKMDVQPQSVQYLAYQPQPQIQYNPYAYGLSDSAMREAQGIKFPVKQNMNH